MVTTRRGYDTESRDGILAQGKLASKRGLGETPDAKPAKRRKSLKEIEKSPEEAQASTRDEPDTNNVTKELGAETVNGSVDEPAVTPRARRKTVPGAPHGDNASGGDENIEKAAGSTKPSEDTPRTRSRAKADKSRKGFEGDIISVSATVPSVSDRSEAQSSEPEDESFYATPATQKAESVYATPATHFKKTTTSSKASQSSANSTPVPRKMRGKTHAESSKEETENDISPLLNQTAAKNSTPKSEPAKPPKRIPIRTASRQENHDNLESTSDSSPKPNPQKEISQTKEETSKTPKSVKARHIRFDSEEQVPPQPEQVPASNLAADEEEEDEEEDSDDDAPEIVTKDTALEQIAKQQQQSAERLAKEEAAALEKRQRKEDRLKEQAEARHLKLVKAKEKQARLDLDLSNLPAFLPEELLAAAPAERPPTPPLIASASFAEQLQKKNKHLKFIDTATKDPKDRKVGMDKVRVLTDRTHLLAPKANGKSKSVRERWLQGRGDSQTRKGFKPGKMERKEAYKGFVRR